MDWSSIESASPHGTPYDHRAHCPTVMHRRISRFSEAPVALPSVPARVGIASWRLTTSCGFEPGPQPSSAGPGPLRTSGQFRAVSTEKDVGFNKGYLAPRSRPCDHPPICRCEVSLLARLLPLASVGLTIPCRRWKGRGCGQWLGGTCRAMLCGWVGSALEGSSLHQSYPQPFSAAGVAWGAHVPPTGSSHPLVAPSCATAAAVSRCRR